MSPREFEQTRRWMRDGSSLLLAAIEAGADQLDRPSGLPGWTRKHVLAHVAANAEAVGNLVDWAATSKPTPMYASPEARAAGIETGSRLRDAELIAWLHRSMVSLDAAMEALTAEQWRVPVVTGQGRTVPATELPWLRCREVFIHAVDLDTGTSFDGLPADFLAALCDDVVMKRSGGPSGPALRLATTDSPGLWELPGEGAEVTVTGPLHEVAAYLTGRKHHVVTSGRHGAPNLPAWL